MFKYQFNVDQLVNEMEHNLELQKKQVIGNQIQDQLTKLANYADHLDLKNKITESDYITNFLKSLAAGKEDPATVGLTIQKMLKNLEEKGTPLNVYCVDDDACSSMQYADTPKEETSGMPDDYEACSICNYDHEYQYDEAKAAHDRIFNDQEHPEHHNEAFYRQEYTIQD